MGLELQPCFSPMLHIKGVFMPFGNVHAVELYYMFSRRAINFSLTPYEYNLSNNPSFQIL